jgi:hypothetical protein
MFVVPRRDTIFIRTEIACAQMVLLDKAHPSEIESPFDGIDADQALWRLNPVGQVA